jgi:hypothetical protein
MNALFKEISIQHGSHDSALEATGATISGFHGHLVATFTVRMVVVHSVSTQKACVGEVERPQHQPRPVYKHLERTKQRLELEEKAAAAGIEPAFKLEV